MTRLDRLAMLLLSIPDDDSEEPAPANDGDRQSDDSGANEPDQAA